MYIYICIEIYTESYKYMCIYEYMYMCVNRYKCVCVVSRDVICLDISPLFKENFNRSLIPELRQLSG